jgi:hypothetical protein
VDIVVRFVAHPRAPPENDPKAERRHRRPDDDENDASENCRGHIGFPVERPELPGLSGPMVSSEG